MKKKNKLKVLDFSYIFFALVVLILRYVPFFKIDLGLLGTSYISFAQKLEYCSTPLLNALYNCNNVGLINTIFWVVFGILIGIQIFILIKKLK